MGRNCADATHPEPWRFKKASVSFWSAKSQLPGLLLTSRVAPSRRVVTDTGTSLYDPGPERQHLRSTAAHNTIQIDAEEGIQWRQEATFSEWLMFL